MSNRKDETWNFWYPTFCVDSMPHFVTFSIQNRYKLIKNSKLNIIFLCHSLYNFYTFKVCFKLIPLFLGHICIWMDMHPRVSYTITNLRHHTFSPWNISLIRQPSPKKSGVSKYWWIDGHPVWFWSEFL